MPAVLNEAQLYEEYNKLTSFELCIHAQELIQDCLNRIGDFLQTFKVTSTNSLFGDQNTFNQRRLRIEELLNTFDTIFQRLRVVSALVHQRKLDLDSQSRPVDQQLQLDQLRKEQADLKEELKQKSAFIKLAIDKVSEIIWQINSMQKIRQQ